MEQVARMHRRIGKRTPDRVEEGFVPAARDRPARTRDRGTWVGWLGGLLRDLRRGLLPGSRDREGRADHDHAGEQRGTEDADPTRSLHLWARLAHGRRHSVSATGRPRMRGRVAAPHGREPIRADMEPRPGLATGPEHADIGAGRVAEAEVRPPELTAGMTAADG